MPNRKVKIAREEVKSSTIKSIGHDPKSKTLEVEFHSRSEPRIYRYFPVSEFTFSELKSAESVGSYFAKNIKTNPNVTYVKI